MIHPIDPGWLRTGDALSKQERRQRRRNRRFRDREEGEEEEPQGQGSLNPDEAKVTFDLVA